MYLVTYIVTFRALVFRWPVCNAGRFFSISLRASFTIASSLFLAGCISYEPRELVPSITPSSDQVSFNNSASTESGISFGLRTSLNESDSLTNITVLPGVRVRSVVPDGPADAAGIRAGDVILEIDGREINHPDLVAALEARNESAGEFSFQVRRNTTVFETNVTARPVNSGGSQARELYRADPVATRAGYITEILESTNQNQAGARIVKLFPGSPLAEHGIEEQDVILAVDGKDIGSAQGLITRLYDDYNLGDRVTLSVLKQNARSGTPVSTTLRLWDPGTRISRVSLGPLFQYESSLNPSRTRLSFIDLWLFSLFAYQQTEGEAEYSVLGLFRFATGYGELVEDLRND